MAVFWYALAVVVVLSGLAAIATLVYRWTRDDEKPLSMPAGSPETRQPSWEVH